MTLNFPKFRLTLKYGNTFDWVVPNSQVQYIGDYVRIVAAICNKYRPALASDKPGDAFLAQRILYLASLTENPLQKLVQQHGKRPVVKEWIKIDDPDVLFDFPQLSESDLRALTVGVYQLKQAHSYTAEHIKDDQGLYEVMLGKEENDLICVHIKSRHVSSKQYYLWIKYDSIPGHSVDAVQGWYCTCPVGSRMVGCCSHIASVLWYLGYAKYNLPLSKIQQSLPPNVWDASRNN